MKIDLELRSLMILMLFLSYSPICHYVMMPSVQCGLIIPNSKKNEGLKVDLKLMKRIVIIYYR